MPFSSLAPALSRALAARSYTELTPVQQAVIAPETAGRDLLVSAKTGSGKTVAYGLAFADDILGPEQALGPAGDPVALVIAPTRELALQVQRELEWLYAQVGARVVSCVGGMDPRREQRALAAGAHIVVGTPGRLRDHLERGQLQLAGLRTAVLDEADEMLDLGFREELEAILDAAPPERRTLLFSATLPKPIIVLARAHQRDALRVSVAGAEETHSDIDYRAIRLAPNDVEHAVVNILRYFEAGAALVFCSTRESVRRLHANLVERGFAVVALSGELSQAERTHALQALRDRRARVCVATDVAARGIDIPDLDLVIHAELPHDAQSLQHRSGRTGRAGRKGVSVILAPHPKRRRAEALFRAAHLDVDWMGPPTAEDIRAKDQDRLVAALRPNGEAAEEDLQVARTLLSGSDPVDVVAALVRARRALLPAPEDLAEADFEAPLAPAARPGFENTAWFTIDIGRRKNADPRWLLPLICRRGGVTKRDIGAIRVFDRETRFEIVADVAAKFLANARKDAGDDIRIEPVDDLAPPPPRDRAHRREGGAKPSGGRYAAKAGQGAKPRKPMVDAGADRPAVPSSSKRQLSKERSRGPEKRPRKS